MKLQIIVILLALVGITTGLAQLGEEQISIIITPEGKAKISQTLFPKIFVSSIDVHIITEKISNLLAKDEKNILLGTSQNQDLLKIATLGASTVELKYNADILTYESGVFKLKYKSELESKVSLPPLSKLVSLNTIPIEITDKEYTLPPGDISLSFTIRPVTSKEFFVPVGDVEYKIEAITAAKIEGFSTNSDEIQFIIKDKAVVLTIIPKEVMNDPNDAILNGEQVEFSQFHQNATHSWIRIDPHEKGLVRILDTSEKTEEGGGCLIATATFGSELAPQVQFLREIRDKQLMNTVSGSSFMTGFNQLYYLFSPTVADFERENQVFKEFVKIGITPMLSTLHIMAFAESENEILGFGIGVILMNVVMYFVVPFAIFYQIKKIIRTKPMRKSNYLGKCSHNVKQNMQKSHFGIITLLVLSVSIASAFEYSYADDEDPIKMVLEITYQNILESRADTETISNASETFFLAGQTNYNEAILALESGDIVTAKEKALVAMALFEDAAEEIGVLEEQASTSLPPGFGSGIESASETGITQGQGLGLGGIPPGILKQITAANIFEIQEQITDIDEEVKELRELIESNDLEVNFEEYEESINLAKEVLANGEIPNAQAKLALANEIKDNLYDQIDAAVEENQDERVAEFVENSITSIEELLEKENLGLTKKAISELETVLDVLKNGEIDEILEKTDDASELAKELDNTTDDETSEDAPGQNKEDAPGNSGDAPGQNKEDAPGNSGDAPGQNKEDNDEGLPPGFGAAGENPSENAFENGQGLGLGKVPPGLAKLFGFDEGVEEDLGDTPEGLPPGFGAAGENPSENAFENGQGLGLGNIPPGQLKKLDYSEFGTYSPDDYYEDPIDDLAEDDYEEKYDKMNKNSKAKEKKEKSEKESKDNKGKGNNNSSGNSNKKPSKVTDLNAVASSSSQIDLSWTAPNQGGSAITGYEIERKSGPGGWSTIITNTGSSNTAYSDSGSNFQYFLYI